MQNTELFDWWLQRTAVYGLAFVFTAGVLFGVLWVCWTLVRILSKRLPGWFDDQAATNTEVRKGMQALVENTEYIHDRTGATQRGLCALGRAGEKFLNRNGERLGVGSDVVILVQQANEALRNGELDHGDD